MALVGRPRTMAVRVPDYVLHDDDGSSSSRSSGAFFARRRGPPTYFSSSFSGPGPASSDAMAALHVLPEPETTREDCCAVCLDGLEDTRGNGEPAAIRSMPCSHSFHEGCIFRWLAVSRVCPCCRFPLPSAAA
ncbi:hypothetical protein BRADI_4g26548v3, partial [Brachypodium distachyon]